jgi:hypothetical protein
MSNPSPNPFEQQVYSNPFEETPSESATPAYSNPFEETTSEKTYTNPFEESTVGSYNDQQPNRNPFSTTNMFED